MGKRACPIFRWLGHSPTFRNYCPSTRHNYSTEAFLLADLDSPGSHATRGANCAEGSLQARRHARHTAPEQILPHPGKVLVVSQLRLRKD